jgi:TPR repeat protein
MRRHCAVLLLACLPATLAAATPNAAEDEKTAALLLQQAKRGDGDAALRLGNLLARDRVSAARYGKAIDWYKTGCWLRDLSACHNVGVSYEQGRHGAKIDYAEAANHYLQAADRAFINSMINLVGLYAEERITGLDHRDGLKWQYIAERAAAQCPDNPLCQSVLEDRRGHRAKLEARLSANDRREARRLAGEWRPAKAK